MRMPQQHEQLASPAHLEGRVHLDDVGVLQVCMQVHLAQHLVAVELVQAASVVHLERDMLVAAAVNGLQRGDKRSTDRVRACTRSLLASK